jgi:hypothetical protein
VTVGIVAPQFSGDGTSYWAEQKNDEIVRGMVRGFRTEFNALLIAKGFNTTGPFDSVDAMTFPEKKGADFILYPDLDMSSGYRIANVRNELAQNYATGRTEAMTLCDIQFAPSGAISLVIKEPLSGEKIWLKKVDVTSPPQKFSTNGQHCSGSAVTQEMRNAWARAHEQMFQTLMKELDRYVNGEEFQNLKKQAAELRARKVY